MLLATLQGFRKIFELVSRCDIVGLWNGILMFGLEQDVKFGFWMNLTKRSFNATIKCVMYFVLRPSRFSCKLSFFLTLTLSGEVGLVSITLSFSLHIPYLASTHVWAGREAGKSGCFWHQPGVFQGGLHQWWLWHCWCFLTKATLWLAQGFFPTRHLTLLTSLITNPGSWTHFSLLLSSVCFPMSSGVPRTGPLYSNQPTSNTHRYFATTTSWRPHTQEIGSWSWNEKAL